MVEIRFRDDRLSQRPAGTLRHSPNPKKYLTSLSPARKVKGVALVTLPYLGMVRLS